MPYLKDIFEGLTGLDYKHMIKSRIGYSLNTGLYSFSIRRDSDYEGVYVLIGVETRDLSTRAITERITLCLTTLAINRDLDFAKVYSGLHTLENVSPPYFREKLPCLV